MYCTICGKNMRIFPGILAYNTTHTCISNSEVICMYDINNECIYCGIPLYLETPKGHALQEFCKGFLQKELRSTDSYLICALRNQTIKKILTTIDRNDIPDNLK